MKQLLQRFSFEVVGIVALAFAAGVAVISAAYGLYALLLTFLSAAASAGLTSLAAIILVGVLAVVLIQLAKKKPAPHDTKARRLDPDTIQQALTVGARWRACWPMWSCSAALSTQTTSTAAAVVERGDHEPPQPGWAGASQGRGKRVAKPDLPLPGQAG